MQHHAAVSGIHDPEHGLKSLLDFGGTLPSRLDETVARLEAADLRRAATVCAELLAEHESRPFGDYVLARLAEPGSS